MQHCIEIVYIVLQIPFHKGLLVGSDSRKNLSMVLLVPCMDFHGLVVSRDTTRP